MRSLLESTPGVELKQLGQRRPQRRPRLAVPPLKVALAARADAQLRPLLVLLQRVRDHPQPLAVAPSHHRRPPVAPHAAHLRLQLLEEKRVRPRLLRVPQALFPRQAQRLVSPRQIRLFQQILHRDMRRNIVRPWQNGWHVGGVRQVDRLDDGARLVSIFRSHDPVAPRESRREFLEQNADALALDPRHLILGADAQYSRYKFDQRINVARIF